MSHIDLPIQREDHTGLPIVYASSLKGCVREVAEGTHREHVDTLFGKDDASEAGQTIFQEGRLLAMPVRSFRGVFVWMTCPLLLARFRRDLEYLSSRLEPNAQKAAADFLSYDVPIPGGDAITTGDKEMLTVGRLIVEDLDFDVSADVQKQGKCKNLALWLATHFLPAGKSFDWWREKMKKHLVLVSDDTFQMIAKLHTQVHTHIKIGDDGIVAEGPWQEEALPVDTLLYSSLVVMEGAVQSVRERLGKTGRRQYFKDLFAKVPAFQIGAGRSTGMGIVRVRVL